MAERQSRQSRRGHEESGTTRLRGGRGARSLGRLLLGVAALALAAAGPAAAQQFPCPANPAWFTRPSLPDFVNDPNTLCGFYQYSWQTFLYLMSPGPQTHGALRVETLPAVVSPAEVVAAHTNSLLSTAVRFRDAQHGNLEHVFHVRGAEPTDIHQAGSQGILVDQNNNLTYYEQFQTAIAGNFIRQCSLMVKNCGTAPAAQSLRFPPGAVELKLSWRVIPKGMPGASTYYILRDVPNLPDNKGGRITADLGLTGMHVVFATTHHPELIWATFEHIDNAPDGPCVPGRTTTPPPGFKTWAFNDPASTSCKGINNWPWPPPQTIPPPPYPITQGFRNWPFGSDLGNPKSRENISVLLNLHQGVLGILPASSVWRNYFLSGGVWTQGGALPAISPLLPNSNEVGSLFIANSAMETFTQYPNPAPPTWTGIVNCMTCHNTNSTGKPPFKVSHAVGTNETSSCPYSTTLPPGCAQTQKMVAGH